MILVIFVQVNRKNFIFLKKKETSFSRDKSKFFVQFFCIEIGKTEFLFSINGSENSSKYQRIHFNEFHDKIIVALAKEGALGQILKIFKFTLYI